MPYITPERRRVNKLNLSELEMRTSGELTYLISVLMNEYLKRTGKSYGTMSVVRACAQDASDEFYRRVMLPYENCKLAENGDVYD